jgi:hypothetical protein
MRISEMLQAIASWLESPDNEAILLAENDDECLKIVAESCVQAAALLKITAETVDDIEPLENSKITPEAIDGLANLASALESSNDEELKKQAAVIDELLLTIAAPSDAMDIRKSQVDKRLEELTKKYQNPHKELQKNNKVEESIKAIDNSNMTKPIKLNEEPLSTRYCPDHPGTQISRIGEHVWQCELDKKIYNFETGFTLNNGTKIPGGQVDLQTQPFDAPYYSMFDTREERLHNK